MQLPDFALGAIRPFDEMVGVAAGTRPLLATGAALSAGFALMLMMLGLYGVTSQLVLSRSREIAIRFALGTTAVQAVGAVIRPIAIVVAIGLPVGALLAIFIARALDAIIPAPTGLVQNLTLSTSIGVAALFVSFGAVTAMLVPALRAAGRNPVERLRRE
jgi:ABC-type antimicrobial peptide transport system permease subunit